MRLVADRFVVEDNGRSFDLATGDRVVVLVSRSGDTAGQLRWAVRCDALQSLRHAAIAPLVDYGLIGTCERFEAWRCGPPWTGAPGAAVRAVERAVAFLRACGHIAECSTSCVRAGAGGTPTVLPDAGTGFAADGSTSVEVAMEARGLALVPRRAVAALAEMFRIDGGARP